MNFGIPYRSRDPGERSSHSTQMIGVMPDTRGRRTGRQHFGGRSAKCVEPHLKRSTAFWKAVCAETCTHGLGRGGEKRIERYLARRLLYLGVFSQHDGALLGKGGERHARAIAPQQFFFLCGGAIGLLLIGAALDPQAAMRVACRVFGFVRALCDRGALIILLDPGRDVLDIDSHRVAASRGSRPVRHAPWPPAARSAERDPGGAISPAARTRTAAFARHQSHTVRWHPGPGESPGR